MEYQLIHADIEMEGKIYDTCLCASKDISLMWVKERIIPSGRQNIGSILKKHRLNKYSEMDILWLSK